MSDVAVITGASRGIGLETAHFLASRGWSIAICSRNQEEMSSALDSWSSEARDRTLAFTADVSKPDQMGAFADATRGRFGSVRALVSNAGVLGPVGRLHTVAHEALSDAVQINLFGFINVYRAFWPLLRAAESSRIVALAGGGLGGPNQLGGAPVYVPTKAALVTLIESLANEVTEIGATVNALAPGNVPTEFLREVLSVGPDVAGETLFSLARDRNDMDLHVTMKQFLELLDYILSRQAHHINGRFLSARWNNPLSLENYAINSMSTNLFRLRRIDNDLFSDLKDNE